MEKVTIGDAELWHADCRELLSSLNKVDAVITDIPYGVINRSSAGLRNLDKGQADVVTCSEGDILKLLALGQSTYCWCSTEQVSGIRAGLVAAGYSTRLGIWEKTNPSPMNGQHLWLSAVECCVYGKERGAYFSEFCKAPVWRGPTERKTYHPTPKPVYLMERLILASVRPGGVVLDPFMGGGSTGVAAIRHGRKFIGIEVDRQFFVSARDRIADEVESRRTK